MAWTFAFFSAFCVADGLASFSTRSGLKAAVDAWATASEPQRQHLRTRWGDISEWNVSAVTNFSGLFEGLADFDERIGAWETSAVTDLSYTFSGATSFNQPLTWDTSAVRSMREMFSRASRFNQSLASWDTSKVEDMHGMFAGASSFNQVVGSWDTSKVRDMKEMFLDASAFDQALGGWKTSAVTGMSGMFARALRFNQAVGGWDTSKVTTMLGMFGSARRFNQPLDEWNTSAVTDMSYMFYYAVAFDQAVGSWDTSKVTTMHSMFSGARSFNHPLRHWKTSNVRDMSQMFWDARSFNQAVGSWDTSKVTTMQAMFNTARSFNQSLDEWNTSAVTDMSYMFFDAFVFDQAVGSWDTSKVTAMQSMFSGARSFNQPLRHWKTSNVRDMSQMFWDARSFNQAVGSWDTSKVTTMKSMFHAARSFNQPLNDWHTSSVSDMSYMFVMAVVFNQAVGCWDTSKVTTMRGMFNKARSFNQPLEDWNTSSVVTMRDMFEDAASFNHPLGKWDTSAVVDMSVMFARTPSFNQPLNPWDMSSVKNTSYMFIHATGFDQPLGCWNTSAVVDMSYMFSGATAFDQPLGTWDFSSVNASMMEGMLTANHISRCNLRSLSQATSLPGRLKRYWGFSTCSSCEARRCPDSKQACVDGECHPVNSNFIELAQGQWAPQQRQEVELVDVARTYRGCAEVCEGSANCSAFVLEKGRCALYIGKGLPEKRGEGTMRAFLKPRCEFFTCPAEGVLMGMEGPAVTAASCCRCRDGRVKNLRVAPELQCISCPAGAEPMSWSSCRPCQPGFISRGSKCERCSEGLEPNAAQSDCRDCPPGHFATADMDACKPCEFPRMLFGDNCAPWPLVVILLFLLVCLGVLFFVSRAVLKSGRKRILARVEQAEKLVQMLDWELWEMEAVTTVETYAAQLHELGWTHEEVLQKAGEIRAQHSRIAGVGMRYLLSDFTYLAEQRAQKPNPDFHELKVAFWFGADPLGEQVPCPRDGEPGCALVDLLPKADRQPQTHFMSWTWRYTLKQIQSALAIWSSSTRIEAERVFFFMCFFVNNQFRIMKDQSSSGSDDLDHVFNSNLRRIGQVVAILDAWHEPIYLQRVWTVYEQYVACSLEVPVTFVMPAEAQRSLTAEINRGEPGINEVTSSLSKVDSANAEAFDPRDEFKVKKAIQETVGFEEVNEHVRQALVQWISGVVRLQFQELLKRQARPKRAEPEPEPAEPVAGSAPALAGGGHEVGRQIIPI
ncbi:unnamed protein product [Durusdinium trenchii]|uniref:Apple domain-containing protein n=1 Tax=Durusdinium trenchii TaxID=1381693 RepID=A0ABP0JQC4_9DINO